MDMEHVLPKGYKVIGESETQYKVETEEGRTLFLYKVDTESISRRYHEGVEKTAKSLEKKEVAQLLGLLNELNSNPPSVVDYLEIATNISKTLKGFYDKVGSPNLFHHFIKDIDPEVYGKAQTFMHKIKLLKDCLTEIKHQIILDNEPKNQ